MKRCAMCGEVKPLDEFHRQPSGPQGRHSYCKPCFNGRPRVRNDTPEQKRRWNLRRRYGMEPVEFEGLLNEQGGVCAICRCAPDRPVVDHDHSTGAVRGILCHGCNIKLPAVEDAEFRAAALRYLEGK